MRITTRSSVSSVFRRRTATYQKYTSATWKHVPVPRGRSTDWISRSHSHFLSYSTGLQSEKREELIIQKRTYDDAISLLNTLQTPYAELKRQWDAGIVRGAEDLQHTKDCFARLGYVSSDLDKLNIVHVAGTKGKGTVCAYVDSILNQYRKSAKAISPSRRLKKIGLYTSPHLISVRERIRINGSPISEELFTKYFFEIWDKLCVLDQEGRPPVTPLPVYFRFLTLMSFHVFISESVDCAIYEVGMGGEYDATNIVQKPAVTGITALGIDHTFHLGKTVDKIAWHKAGIFKKGVAAYTVSQPPEACAVLKDRAQEIGTTSLSKARVFNAPVQPQTKFQQQNAGLAIELAKDIINLVNSGYFKLHCRSMRTPILPKTFQKAIKGVVSRGRCELKVTDKINWYLDGAHTTDSIDIAIKWFHIFKSSTNGPRVLIFNQQGHRESMELLERLFAIAEAIGVEFDHAIFCPSLPPVDSVRKDHVNHQADLQAVAEMTIQRKFAARWLELSSNSSNHHRESHIKFLPNLEEAFSYVRNIPLPAREGEEVPKVHVFITGSMHLVGRALSLLEGVDCL